MSQKVFSKDAEPTNVEQIDILSNIDPSKSVSVIGGFAGLTYTESIMSDTIKVNVSFIDSGDSLEDKSITCLLYTSPSPRDRQKSRMPSSA